MKYYFSNITEEETKAEKDKYLLCHNQTSCKCWNQVSNSGSLAPESLLLAILICCSNHTTVLTVCLHLCPYSF